MDVVYVLGTGSGWQDNELRYSLRSVEKHLKDYDRVIIAGEKPDFLQNITHIPCKDGSQKERNIMAKLLKVCDTDVSNDFFFLNDDHFLLQDVSTTNFPYYFHGTLKQTASKRHPYKPYTSSLWNTHEALIKNNFEAKYYDIHVPIVYNKVKYPQAMSMYEWKIPYCYTVKSIYCNTLGLPGKPFNGDLKIDKRHTREQLDEMLAGRLCFSIGNGALTPVLKNLFETMYPEKSKYEK